MNSKYSYGFLWFSYIVISGCTTGFSNHTDPHLFNELCHHDVKIDLNFPTLESPRYKALGIPVFATPLTMKSLIVAHERLSPTPYTQTFDELKTCRLIGMRIELDDQQKTVEWLITPDNDCPSHSPNKVKTFWIIQQNAVGKHQVVLADRAKLLSIGTKPQKQQGAQKTQNMNKNKIKVNLEEENEARIIKTSIEVSQPSRFTGKPVPVVCHSFWESNDKGLYVRQKGFVEVYRNDPMLSYRQWWPVKGEDTLTRVAEDFACPMD